MRPGFTVTPQQDEVADVFEVPLAFLMDPAGKPLAGHWGKAVVGVLHPKNMHKR